MVTAHEWPPAADESTQWREFTPIAAREAVRARQIQLWGRLVWCADLEGEHRVWCPDCRAFLSLEVLGKPYNGHAVGVPTPSGSVVTFGPGDDGPGSRYVDPFFRRVWDGRL